MIKFFAAKYELHDFSAANVNFEEGKHGALLKVQWPNGNIGYADVHPLINFGDSPIDAHLEALAKGKMSTLVEQAIWMAKKDSVMRQNKTNAFSTAVRVKNHYLITDFTKFTDSNLKEVRTSGFTTLKMKVGFDLDEEAKFVVRTIKQNPVLMRLDFNARVGYDEFIRFMAQIGPTERAKIEFVEDPMPWNHQAWIEAAKLVTLAADHEMQNINLDKIKGSVPFKVVVIKPARQDVEKLVKTIDRHALKMVITSSMDHPVGIAHAGLVAAELKKFYPNTLLDCGCLTLRTYRPNEFTMRVMTQGPYITGVAGTGIGFDDLFAKQTWVPVK